jgi:hypothetical protein
MTHVKPVTERIGIYMKTHKIKIRKRTENAGKQQITSENKVMPTMKT